MTFALEESTTGHWRAVCGESCTHGSEGAHWKSVCLTNNSLVRYPTSEAFPKMVIWNVRNLGSGYPVNDRLRLYIIMNHLVTR